MLADVDISNQSLNDANETSCIEDSSESRTESNESEIDTINQSIVEINVSCTVVEDIPEVQNENNKIETVIDNGIEMVDAPSSTDEIKDDVIETVIEKELSEIDEIDMELAEITGHTDSNNQNESRLSSNENENELDFQIFMKEQSESPMPKDIDDSVMKDTEDIVSAEITSEKENQSIELDGKVDEIDTSTPKEPESNQDVSLNVSTSVIDLETEHPNENKEIPAKKTAEINPSTPLIRSISTASTLSRSFSDDYEMKGTSIGLFFMQILNKFFYIQF